jgi:hypothetical protein
MIHEIIKNGESTKIHKHTQIHADVWMEKTEQNSAGILEGVVEIITSEHRDIKNGDRYTEKVYFTISEIMREICRAFKEAGIEESMKYWED